MLPTLSASRAAILLMVGGIFLFAVNDVVGKWLAGLFPAGQILFVRSIGALLVLAPIAWRAGLGPWRAAPRPALQAWRVALCTLEVLLFYVAVATEPLALVMSIYLAAPILVAALGPLIGERVPARRWAFVALGFCGVLLVLRPTTASLSAGTAAALAGALAFAGLMLTTRALRGTHDVVLVGAQTFGALVLGAALLPLGFVPPSPRDLAALLGIGIVAMTAHALVNRSLQMAPASVVTPYQYTLLVWAVLFGWLVFDEPPTAATLAGATIIVLAGLAIFRDEQRAGAGKLAPSAAAPGEIA